MRLFLIISIFISVNIFAKPIEAKQLFNRKIIKVKKEHINYTKSYYAKTTIDESKIKDMTLKFSGFIKKLYVTKSYQMIQKRDKLFTIYSKEISSLLDEYRVFKKDSIKQRLINLDIQKSEFNKKRDIDFYSKYSGFVIQKNIFEGGYIKSGQNILRVADLRDIWVIAKVYQEDLKYIKRDLKAKIFIDGVGTFLSKVDFIYPTVDKSSKTIDIRLVLPNKDIKIFPNMFAKVKIRVDSKDALVLPKSAILTKSDKHFVFIPNGKEFSPKEIKAKRIASKKFEILSGLKEGDKVIDRVMFMLDSDAITNGLYDEDDEDW